MPSLSRSRNLVLILLLMAASGRAQMPEGFRWLDLMQEPATTNRIANALRTEKYSAIREVGVMEGFYLVFTVRLDVTADIPENGEYWTVYSLPARGGSPRKLLAGNHLEMHGWMKFRASAGRELGVVYYSCWECEAQRIFTSLHLDPVTGWSARWGNRTAPESPGIVYMDDGAAEPFDDVETDQVYAVFSDSAGAAAVGVWTHSRELKTGKITDVVYRYTVDPETGRDRAVHLVQPSTAEPWKEKLCRAEDSVMADGQNSSSCRQLLKKAKSSAQSGNPK